jgi:benzodiazapine receptor
MTSIAGLIVSLLVCFGAALVGSRFLPDEWFRRLKKPTWNPPNWVFAPVWTVLYALMAVASWRVWDVAGFAGAGVALVLFAVQLVLNATWSVLFFGRHRPDLAMGDIAIIWLAILATTLAFLQVDQWAGLLLVPYLAWVSFASFLNLNIWRLNSES